MTFNSVVSLALLVAFTASSLETVAGLVRDGEVHHETTASAAVHGTSSSGEHGHEAVDDGGTHEHGPEHEHGTGSDHCTHTHGNALAPSGAAFACLTSGAVITASPSRIPTESRLPPLLQPPRV